MEGGGWWKEAWRELFIWLWGPMFEPLPSYQLILAGWNQFLHLLDRVAITKGSSIQLWKYLTLPHIPGNKSCHGKWKKEEASGKVLTINLFQDLAIAYLMPPISLPPLFPFFFKKMKFIWYKAYTFSCNIRRQISQFPAVHTRMFFSQEQLGVLHKDCLPSLIIILQIPQKFIHNS